jgi:glycosyltransferase involved in cell wall biosynthesis
MKEQGQSPLLESLVSVLIANFNHNYARYLPLAVDSVPEHTYRHFEIIVCGDGSTDD